MAKIDLLDQSEQLMIETFADYLWMEFSLSENTLSAYKNDLADLGLWLKKRIAHSNKLTVVC